jgi:hypothetical protein
VRSAHDASSSNASISAGLTFRTSLCLRHDFKHKDVASITGEKYSTSAALGGLQ